MTIKSIQLRTRADKALYRLAKSNRAISSYIKKSPYIFKRKLALAYSCQLVGSPQAINNFVNTLKNIKSDYVHYDSATHTHLESLRMADVKGIARKFSTKVPSRIKMILFSSSNRPNMTGM